MIWRLFAETDSRPVLQDELPRLMAIAVADLRAAHARRPDDAEVNALIRDLLEVSAEFRELWQRHDVAVRHRSAKTLVHPQIGLLELECEVLLSASAQGSSRWSCMPRGRARTPPRNWNC